MDKELKQCCWVSFNFFWKQLLPRAACRVEQPPGNRLDYRSKLVLAARSSPGRDATVQEFQNWSVDSKLFKNVLFLY